MTFKKKSFILEWSGESSLSLIDEDAGSSPAYTESYDKSRYSSSIGRAAKRELSLI